MKTNNKRGFSIIEIMIGMFIFSLGILSIYALISSSVRLNDYNKNYIIASHLAREQLELMRNNRDYNYGNLQKFDQINPVNSDYTNVFSGSTFYKLENSYSSSDPFPIIIEELSATDFGDDENYRLCLDGNNMYIYCSGATGEKETIFYKYTYIDKLSDEELKISSKVIWKSSGIHEFEVNTILTDWKQL